MVLFSRAVLPVLGPLSFHMHVKINLSVSSEASWDFDGGFIESVE